MIKRRLRYVPSSTGRFVQIADLTTKVASKTSGDGRFPTSALGNVTTSIGKLIDKVDTQHISIQAQPGKLIAA